MSLFLWIFYPIFFGFLLLLSFAIAMNGKRIRGKWKFDAIIFYMLIYLGNVFFVLGVLKAGVPALIITTLIMLYVIVRTNKIQIIGITGNSGSGKSSAVKLLHEDFKTNKIDGDELIKRIIRDNKGVYATLQKEFGNDLFDDKKDLNKNFIQETVLPREPIRKKLAGILEVPLMKELLKEAYNITKNDKGVIAFDAPQLFDFKILPWMCYPTITVFNTETALPVKRVAERDNISLSEASKLVSAPQGLIGRMLKRADIQINNDGDLNALKYKLVNELASFLL